jgi:uncharacterized Zn-finger protein
MNRARAIRNFLKRLPEGVGENIAKSCMLSYRPVSGGFRCNQTGKFTKDPQQYAKKFNHINLEGKRMSHPKEQYPLKIPDRDNQINCDGCHRWLDVHNFTVVTCLQCGRKYRTRKIK